MPKAKRKKPHSNTQGKIELSREKVTNNKMMSAKRVNWKYDSARSSKYTIYFKEFQVVKSTSSCERELKGIEIQPQSCKS